MGSGQEVPAAQARLQKGTWWEAPSTEGFSEPWAATSSTSQALVEATRVRGTGDTAPHRQKGPRRVELPGGEGQHTNRMVTPWERSEEEMSAEPGG